MKEVTSQVHACALCVVFFRSSVSFLFFLFCFCSEYFTVFLSVVLFCSTLVNFVWLLWSSHVMGYACACLWCSVHVFVQLLLLRGNPIISHSCTCQWTTSDFTPGLLGGICTFIRLRSWYVSFPVDSFVLKKLSLHYDLQYVLWWPFVFLACLAVARRFIISLQHQRCLFGDVPFWMRFFFFFFGGGGSILNVM